MQAYKLLQGIKHLSKIISIKNLLSEIKSINK